MRDDKADCVWFCAGFDLGSMSFSAVSFREDSLSTRG